MEVFFRHLYETTGFNFSIFYDRGNELRFLRGLMVSLELMALSLVGSLAIGVGGAWLSGARSRIVRASVRGYIQVFRNTPPLIQLYFFFFALGSVLSVMGPNGRPTPLVNNFTWACIGLSAVAGAFNIEIFRAGIESVPRAVRDAATALGLSRSRTFFLVVLPLAFRLCLPALNNNLVNLLKSTTLAYAIGVPEVLYVSAQIWSDEFNATEMMLVVLVVYAGITTALIGVMQIWERRLKMPGYGT
jgi:polar amino acid transport system permease protein